MNIRSKRTISTCPETSKVNRKGSNQSQRENEKLNDNKNIDYEKLTRDDLYDIIYDGNKENTSGKQKLADLNINNITLKNIIKVNEDDYIEKQRGRSQSKDPIPSYTSSIIPTERKKSKNNCYTFKAASAMNNSKAFKKGESDLNAKTKENEEGACKYKEGESFVVQLEEKLEHSNKMLPEIISQTKEYEKEIHVLTEQRTKDEGYKKKLNEEKEKLVNINNKLKKEIEKNKELINKGSKNLDTIKEDNNNKDNEIHLLTENIKKSIKELKELNSKSEDLSSQNASLHNELRKLSEEKSQIETERTKRINDGTDQIQETRKGKEKTEKQLKTVNDKVSYLDELNHEKSAKIEELIIIQKEKEEEIGRNKKEIVIHKEEIATQKDEISSQKEEIVKNKNEIKKQRENIRQREDIVKQGKEEIIHINQENTESVNKKNMQINSLDMKLKKKEVEYNTIIENKENEIQELNKKEVELQKELGKGSTKIKECQLNNEELKEDLIEKEKVGKENKVENKKLKETLEVLTETIENKDNDIKKTTKKLNEIIDVNREIINNSTEKEKQYTEIIEKQSTTLNALIREKAETLSQISEQKEVQITILKEKEKINLELVSKNEELIKLRDVQINEIQTMKNQVINLQEETTAKTVHIEKLENEGKEKNFNFSNEITVGKNQNYNLDQISNSITQINDENFALQIKLKDRELVINKGMSRNEEYNKELSEVKRERNHINMEKIKGEEQGSISGTQVTHYKKQVNDYQSKIDKGTIENINNTNEINQLKLVIDAGNKEDTKNNDEKYSVEGINKLREMYEESKEIISRGEGEVNIYKDKITNADSVNKQKDELISNVNQKLNEKSQGLESKIIEYNKGNTQLTTSKNMIFATDVESNGGKSEIALKEKEIQELQSIIKEHKGKEIKYKNDIDTLKISNKNIQNKFDSGIKKNEKYEHNIQEQSSKISVLQNKLTLLTAEAESHEKSQSKISKGENENFELNEQIKIILEQTAQQAILQSNSNTDEIDKIVGENKKGRKENALLQKENQLIKNQTQFSSNSGDKQSILINTQKEEIELLKLKYNHKVKELEEYKSQVKDKEHNEEVIKLKEGNNSQNDDICNLRNTIQLLKANSVGGSKESEDNSKLLEAQISQGNNEINETKLQLNVLNEEYSSGANENALLKECEIQNKIELKEIHDEYEKCLEKLSGLQTEHTGLNNQLNDGQKEFIIKGEEISGYKGIIDKLTKTNLDLSKRIRCGNENESENENNFDEADIESLQIKNNTLQDLVQFKEEEIKIGNKKVEMYKKEKQESSSNSNITQTVEHLKNDNDERKDEIEMLKSQLSGLKGEITNYKAQIEEMKGNNN